jgi:predicted nucleic acid-binding protein
LGGASASAEAGRIVALAHDARIAALCINTGAELWSADRDFGRYPSLTVINPLVG